MFSLFDRQKALDMVYDETNTCEDVKHNYLRETGSLNDR